MYLFSPTRKRADASRRPTSSPGRCGVTTGCLRLTRSTSTDFGTVSIRKAASCTDSFTLRRPFEQEAVRAGPAQAGLSPQLLPPPRTEHPHRLGFPLRLRDRLNERHDGADL